MAQPLVRRQITLGLMTVFTLYFTSSFFVQTLGIVRPRMAAELNGMALYSWSLSIPGLAGAFATLLFSKFSDMYGRRIMLMISMIISLVGTILSALSPTFPTLIAANTLSRLGGGALFPICNAVLADMFPPVERSKWVGMLNIPTGIFALVGPVIGGWFADNLSWRYLYWMGVPLLILGIVLVAIGIPPATRKATCRIDVHGAILVGIASSATILGLSFAGTTYPWGSIQVFGLLGGALLFWIIFFKFEHTANEPIIDPQVFRNRTFLTISLSAMMSFFGMMAMMMYYPWLLQGVQGISVTKSGLIITPYTVLMAFVGVPTGFMLAKTKRYKWMLISGYGLLTAVTAGIVFFNSETPVYMGALAAGLSGLGLGAIPTVNTLVVQFAVPRRLLGAALGASFFTISMGMAISPAVLGSVMGMSYSSKLEATLPAGLHQFADKATMAVLGDPKSLFSPKAMKDLKTTFDKAGEQKLFGQTVEVIRDSVEAGVRSVFLFGAVTMLISFLLVLSIPEVSMDAVVEDRKKPQAVVAEETAV